MSPLAKGVTSVVKMFNALFLKQLYILKQLCIYLISQKFLFKIFSIGYFWCEIFSFLNFAQYDIFYRFHTKSLFSQLLCQYKNFHYKFPNMLKRIKKNAYCKYCRRPSRIFLCGESGCEKNDQWEPCF